MKTKDQKGRRVIYKWINRETRGSDSNAENLYTWSNERKIKQGGEFKVVKDEDLWGLISRREAEVT